MTLENPLSWSEYVRTALGSNQFGDSADAIQNFRFGYFGQVGSLMSVVKKSDRDVRGASVTAFAVEEIGDALWYLAALSAASGVQPDDLGLACIQALRRRFQLPLHEEWPDPTFRHADGVVAAQRAHDLADRVTTLRDLAYQAGVLMHEADPQLDFRHVPDRAKRLGKLAAGLVLAAERFGTTLEAAAAQNLAKIRRRWPGPHVEYAPLFDDGFPEHEQLPRRFAVDYIERGTPERPVVTQSINGVFVGDQLSDNIIGGDGYRFHDVFHLAYVAHLGWSPVIRGLLRRKRRSQPKVDENQDGARAAIIEEGIATWIFNHAKAQDHYASVREGKLDYTLLKQIDQMVQGYEVDRVPLWQWERAILSGMEVFRSLREARKGRVEVDMLAHAISFKPTDSAS